jgi:hypothetical protein
MRAGLRRILGTACAAALWLPVAAQQPGSDLLVIHGNRYDVGVLEPAGWHGRLQGDRLTFTRSGEDPDQATTLIRVQVETKADKNASDNFDFALQSYKGRYPDVASTTLDVSHPSYRASGRVFTVWSKLHDYVAYVNPKKRGTLLLCVSLSTGAEPATDADRIAFNSVLRSLVMLTGDGS